VGKAAGRRPLERPRHRWDDNIKMDLRDVVWETRTRSIWFRIGERWWALVNEVMNLMAAEDQSTSYEELCSMKIVMISVQQSLTIDS
jgi:hypothetical protein